MSQRCWERDENDPWRDPTAPQNRVYSASVYQRAGWMMNALDRLSERHEKRGRAGSCECDVDFCCPEHERHQRVAIRYAEWRERRLSR